MYWIYLILFIIAVLVPDIIHGSIYIFSEERFEELLIFLIGMAGFLIFVLKEHQLAIQQREGEKNQKRLYQTSKDLVESYSYIGEVNRKMDILMQIGLGLSDRSELNKHREQEIYSTIIDAADSLMKSECSCIRFINMKNGKVQKEICSRKDCEAIKNSELRNMHENINIKKSGNHLIISSLKEINEVKGYLIILGYSKLEEKNPNNQEILKYLATQALFLYSYATRSEKTNS